MPRDGRDGRDGLELLTDTLGDQTDKSRALGRVLKAIDKGTLTVNGQTPDNAYSIGEYLIHGGRIKFDVSQLNAHQQDAFFNHITNNQAQARTFATHRAGGIDASGSPAEAKSGLIGAIFDAARGLVGKSKHYGINLAIGGSNKLNKEGHSQDELPDESGQWGHMYLHKDSNIVLVGIEPSGPGVTNKRTQEAHSKTGGAGEHSPFLEYKINSEALQQEQRNKGNNPLSVKEKYNWATIKVTPQQLDQLMTADDADNHASLVNKIPANAAPPAPNHVEKMQAWSHATKKSNKPSMFAKVMGGLLIAVGIVIAAVPIPVVTQAIGGGIAAIGIGIAAGLVGLGLVGSDIRGSQSAAQKQYEKNLAKIERDNPSEELRSRHPGLDSSISSPRGNVNDSSADLRSPLLQDIDSSSNDSIPPFRENRSAPLTISLSPNSDGIHPEAMGKFKDEITSLRGSQLPLGENHSSTPTPSR